MKPNQNITVFILAGGKSTRMGSDKGLVHFNGKKLIEHGIQTCKKITDDIRIVTNNPDYAFAGLNLVSDVVKDSGPLAGIYSALLNSTNRLNLFLSCDMPFINTETLEFLINNYNEQHQAFVVTHNQQPEPLCAIYTPECTELFKKRIDENQLGVYNALKFLNCYFADITNEPFYSEIIFSNVNSPDDLKLMEEVKND